MGSQQVCYEAATDPKLKLNKSFKLEKQMEKVIERGVCLRKTPSNR